MRVRGSIKGLKVEKILEVAEAIENGRAVCPLPSIRKYQGLPESGPIELGFNMNLWGPSTLLQDRSERGCGTVACIGGWTNVLNGQSMDVHLAASTLGLEGIFSSKSSRSFELFYPKDLGSPDLTASRAAAVLRHLAKTGEVNWDRFDKKGRDKQCRST